MSLRMRRHLRYPLNGKVRVSWENTERQQNATVARIVDISVEGMQISCAESIPPRSIIQFQFMDKFFEGSASVRSCSRQGINYRIGLEFCGGLQWAVPDAAAPEAAAPATEEPTYTE